LLITLSNFTHNDEYGKRLRIVVLLAAPAAHADHTCDASSPRRRRLVLQLGLMHMLSRQLAEDEVRWHARARP